MAQLSQLPCNGDNICMVCNVKPPPEETLTCLTCATPWHVTCTLPEFRPDNHADAVQWNCPDCSLINPTGNPGVVAFRSNDSSASLIATIKAIESDSSLSELEKAKRRQKLLSGTAAESDGDDVDAEKKNVVSGDLLPTVGGNLNCSVCLQTLDRPVTTPCGHNFCLKCFQKWTAQGRHDCANCRTKIPSSMATNPRINAALVFAIRMEKMSISNTVRPEKVINFVHNQDKPDKAYVSERAKKAGKANACSGRIFVSIPSDHFGPILAENDPVRNQGVLVGECWEGRLECRQWGVHFPPVAGIAGQSAHGAQSVVLSGGYVDDEDHGEWFLYTGSGGRDLSGNKRTNKEQSFDQKFVNMNEALRISCLNGYPVRVIRSHKEKRSSYAPVTGLRYDGIYRIEKCWRKNGIQGYKVCRYMFVRCDNGPAPWSSDDSGDRPRPLPVIKELEDAIDISERKGCPFWDYDGEKGSWVWKKPSPCSRKQFKGGNAEDAKMRRIGKQQKCSIQERLRKEFSCPLCRCVMTNPVTTPCGHNFCRVCLEREFAGTSLIKERTCEGRRTLRSKKNVMKCPSCSSDIADFVQHPKVNIELMNSVESLQSQIVQTEENSEESNKDIASTSEEKDTVFDDTESLETLSDEAKAVLDDETIMVEVDKKELSANPAALSLQEGLEDGRNESIMVDEEQVHKNKRARIEVAKVG